MGDKRIGNDQGPGRPRSVKMRDSQTTDAHNTNDTENLLGTKSPPRLQSNHPTSSKPPSRNPSNNPTACKPATRMPSNNPTTSKPASRMPSNTATPSQTPQKVLGQETDYAELQKRLQGEVARAVDMWRKGMVQGTLESQNERIEYFIKQLEDDNFGAKDKTSCSILAELKRENDQLRNELEEMRKLDVNDITVERLQELQHDNKNLRAIIAKLQEEVQERNAVHHRKIREQQDIIRRSQANSDSSESAVNRLKIESQELKAKVAELTKSSEEEETDETKKLNCQLCPAFDLNEKLSKAEHRLQIACLELNLKRKRPKRIPAHSIKSLEDIACVWTQHVNLLNVLLKKEKEMNVLKDRLEMFVSNIEILKDENLELSTRLAGVRDEMKMFRENPMKPAEHVVKNVNLLLHMEKIDGSLAEKAVQLDKNEKDLKREQLRVREILIRVEELRRENRHLTRRLQKDAARRDYQSQSVISNGTREDSSSSCSNSEQVQLLDMDPVYGTALEEGDGIGVEISSEGTEQPERPEEADNQPNYQSVSDGTDVQAGSDTTTDGHQISTDPQEESDVNDSSYRQVECIPQARPKSAEDSQASDYSSTKPEEK